MAITITVYLALFGWIPFVVVLFALMPPQRAAAAAVVGAWLALPPAAVVIAGLPDISKSTVSTAGVMLGTLIFGSHHVLNFRPRWFDLPMLLWCFTGVVTSLQNGLGIYDGLSDALNASVMWGLPYLVGRLYFNNPKGLHTFLFAMTIGGLAYVLPCLWESRMSPNLLANIYGISHWMGLRFGGYRPHVFFWSGLECGLWMTAASLTAWWQWNCGTIKKIGPVPFGPVLLPILLGTTILCRATGALILLASGMIILWISTRIKTRLILASLLLVGPLYVTARASGTWSGQHAVDLAESVISSDRAYSLRYRFMCEDLLIARAIEQPILGWGGWGRSAVYFNADKRWRKMVETDGMWIIILGAKGFVGLICVYLAMSLPSALFLWRFPVRLWRDPHVAGGLVAAVLLALYIVDCLVNGFVNIIYITLVGGLMGFEPKALRMVATPSGKQAVDQTGGATSARAGQLARVDGNRGVARALKAEGRLNEAEAVWRQTLQLLITLKTADPHDPDIQRRYCDCANDLVWFWADHDTGRHDLGTAVAMAQRIVEEYPDAAIYWNTLGVAQYRAGDDASAITALERAATLGGSTPFNDVFLAMAHARSGNRQESELRLTQAILQIRRDYPEHPELNRFYDEARSMLAEGAGEHDVVR